MEQRVHAYPAEGSQMRPDTVSTKMPGMHPVHPDSDPEYSLVCDGAARPTFPLVDEDMGVYPGNGLSHDIHGRLKAHHSPRQRRRLCRGRRLAGLDRMACLAIGLWGPGLLQSPVTTVSFHHQHIHRWLSCMCFVRATHSRGPTRPPAKGEMIDIAPHMLLDRCKSEACDSP